MWPFCCVNISIILNLKISYFFKKCSERSISDLTTKRMFLLLINMQKTMTQIDLSESSLFLFSVQERDLPGFYLMILPLKLIFSEGADPNILGFFPLKAMAYGKLFLLDLFATTKVCFAHDLNHIFYHCEEQNIFGHD